MVSFCIGLTSGSCLTRYCDELVTGGWWLRPGEAIVVADVLIGKVICLGVCFVTSELSRHAFD